MSSLRNTCTWSQSFSSIYSTHLDHLLGLPNGQKSMAKSILWVVLSNHVTLFSNVDLNTVEDRQRYRHCRQLPSSCPRNLWQEERKYFRSSTHALCICRHRWIECCPGTLWCVSRLTNTLLSDWIIQFQVQHGEHYEGPCNNSCLVKPARDISLFNKPKLPNWCTICSRHPT